LKIYFTLLDFITLQKFTAERRQGDPAHGARNSTEELHGKTGSWQQDRSR
jgi:hypothetical protein